MGYFVIDFSFDGVGTRFLCFNSTCCEVLVMSPSKQKRKGSDFERLAVKLLNEFVNKSRWHKVAGSGAIGTIVSEPLLMGDIKGTVDSFPKKFKVEAKVGYSNSSTAEARSFTLQKKWLDKIREEASTDYSFPFLIGKFENVREGTKVFVVMDINEFVEIMNYITELKEQLEK